MSPSQSLLSKYGIPISHLSYEYIESCDKVKELEKIVRILKSGEEGFFPNLQESAENRLRCIDPNNRHLRWDTSGSSKQPVSNQELEEVLKDLVNWEQTIADRDEGLAKENIDEEDYFVPIRNTCTKTRDLKDVPLVCSSSERRVCDYATWDKYDVDSELLKMELEEEKLKEIKIKEKREDNHDRLEGVVRQADKLVETERKVLAEKEINKGNEYYRARDFNEAVKCYSASIVTWPSAKGYNNRAASYLALERYQDVLKDTNMVLNLEPDNIKALYRRCIAYRSLKLFREALDDLHEVLRKDPSNIAAQHLAEQVKNERAEEKMKGSTTSSGYRHNEKRPHRNHKFSPVGPSTSNVKIVELSEDPCPSNTTRLRIVEVG